MKKAYTKPDIVFESIALSTNIAAGCEKIINTLAENACAYMASGNIPVFTGLISDCLYKPTDYSYPDDDKWDDLCYHVPTETYNLFNS